MGSEILRCGLKFTTPRLVYASLVASERKLRMTARTPLKSAHGKPYLQMSISFQRVMSNDILVYSDLDLYINDTIDKYTCQ